MPTTTSQKVFGAGATPRRGRMAGTTDHTLGIVASDRDRPQPGTAPPH